MIQHPTLLAALGLFAQMQIVGLPQPDPSVYRKISCYGGTYGGSKS